MMRSLYVKFSVLTIGIMLLSSLLAFMFANFYYQHRLKPANDAKNTEIAIEIARFTETLAPEQLEPYLENIAAVGYQMLLVDEQGSEIFFGDPFRKSNLGNKAKENVLDGEIYHGILQFPQETFVTGFFANEIKNTIGVPIDFQGENYALFLRPNIKLLFNEMHFLFAWLLLLTVLLSILFVWISTRFLVQPVEKLTEATKDLAEGNFSIRLDIDREDEIGRLAQHFTTMAKQLAMLDEMKNEFIENVSHDIQTPLMNIKGYTELLGDENRTEEEKIAYISVIQQEIDRLSRLTKQLLLLSSLDREEESFQMEAFDVAAELKKVILNHQWLLNERELMVSYTLPEVTIKGNASLLYNVWENLFVNAIKYNQIGGQIDIHLMEEKEVIKVQFIDTGIGMNQEESERVFERFYRVDSSRTKAVEGTGLGLAIVSSIVALHKGRLEIASEPGKGSTLTVVLPKL